jgi:hypothetical protein
VNSQITLGAPDGTDIVHFISVLATEGQRVAVIITAARLDYVLERILTKLMPPMKSAPDELFDTDRPLGSFGS